MHPKVNYTVSCANVVFGGVMAGAGLFELATGHKAGQSLHEFTSNLPNIVYQAIDNLDKAPTLYKCILGGISFGLGIEAIISRRKSKKKMQL